MAASLISSPPLYLRTAVFLSNQPGPPHLVSGVAQGVSEIVKRAEVIVEREVTLEIMHVVVGREGVALLLHNTGEWKGKLLDEYLTTVCTLREGKIARLDTYISDVPMVDAYFV